MMDSMRSHDPFHINPFSRSISSFVSRTMYFFPFPISHPPAAYGRAVSVE
jgi:hypothetical protein